MQLRPYVTSVCVVLALLFGMTQVGLGIAEARRQTGASQAGPPPQQPNMQDMMKMHEQMMAEMKAFDAKLDVLVKEMNSASGDAKVTAMASVVNELVRQHKAMHGRMGEIHQQMMGGRGRMMGR